MINNIIRKTFLFLLGLCAMFLLFCEPVEDSSSWTSTLLLSKFAAALLILLMRYLYLRWYYSRRPSSIHLLKTVIYRYKIFWLRNRPVRP